MDVATTRRQMTPPISSTAPIESTASAGSAAVLAYGRPRNPALFCPTTFRFARWHRCGIAQKTSNGYTAEPVSCVCADLASAQQTTTWGPETPCTLRVSLTNKSNSIPCLGCGGEITRAGVEMKRSPLLLTAAWSPDGWVVHAACVARNASRYSGRATSTVHCQRFHRSLQLFACRWAFLDCIRSGLAAILWPPAQSAVQGVVFLCLALSLRPRLARVSIGL